MTAGETRWVGIFRHGTPSKDNALGVIGAVQMTTAADQLRTHRLADHPAIILTSPATRARLSANIFSGALGIAVETDERLGSEDGHSRGYHVLEAIEERDETTVIVVTHATAVHELSEHYQRNLNLAFGLSEAKFIGKEGHGVVFDLATNQATAI